MMIQELIDCLAVVLDPCCLDYCLVLVQVMEVVLVRAMVEDLDRLHLQVPSEVGYPDSTFPALHLDLAKAEDLA
jgi:hypothetical protein